MRYAIIDGDTVVNIVEADADLALANGWVKATADAEIGGSYADGVFTRKPAPEPDPPTAGDVKREANRRILSLVPEWRQRNLTARAVELAMIGKANWTKTEADEWAAGQAVWDAVKLIRARSDEIEAITPIPADFTNDRYWS